VQTTGRLVSAVILATGDLAPDRPQVDTLFAATASQLSAADLVFGQLETTFAAAGVRLPQARHAVLAHPDGAAALARAGFDVISCAGNHCLDWGSAALKENIGHLRAAGLDVVGAGANLEEARRPVVRTLADGTRVAFLAYCSILPEAYWAEGTRAGCAPLRAATLYEQVERDQPGTPARVRTFALPEDLAAMAADIRAAKQQADLVLVSHHWGIHFVRAVIADYQREVARAAIDAGADAILGHHAHILKAIELIDGKPVFYSLCNFATDLRMDAEHAARKSFKEIQSLAEEWVPDFESSYNFPAASRLSLMARFEIRDRKIAWSGFQPLYIGRDAVPTPLDASDPRFGEVQKYIEAVTAEAHMQINLRVDTARNLVEIVP
jgi:poly-gamma-glutamate capsule biosynthesis protein CapA/YwtB (metallophosphatase superfamily)